MSNKNKEITLPVARRLKWKSMGDYLDDDGKDKEVKAIVAIIGAFSVIFNISIDLIFNTKKHHENIDIFIATMIVGAVYWAFLFNSNPSKFLLVANINILSSVLITLMVYFNVNLMLNYFFIVYWSFNILVVFNAIALIRYWLPVKYE